MSDGPFRLKTNDLILVGVVAAGFMVDVVLLIAFGWAIW
jgi:hypothetical protein